MKDTNVEWRMTNDEKLPKIKKFTDMKVWRESRKLVKSVYETTYTFPKDEVFGLTSQMKRASISVPSNIAEGFRRDTMKDKLHFYIMSHGSLTELQNQIILSHDLELIDDRNREELYALTETVDALLTGLIRATKERI